MAPSQMRALAGVAAVLASSVVSLSTAVAGPDEKKNPAFRAAERSQQPRKTETPRQEAPRQTRPAPESRPAPAPRTESRNPTSRAAEAARANQDRAKAAPPPQARPEAPRPQERTTQAPRREQPAAAPRSSGSERNPALRGAERASTGAKPAPAPTTTDPAPAPRSAPTPDAARPARPSTWTDRGTVDRGDLPRGGGLRAAEIAKRNRPADGASGVPLPPPDAAGTRTGNGRGGRDDAAGQDRAGFDRSGFDRSGSHDRSSWDVVRRDDAQRGDHDRRHRDSDRWSVSIGFHTGNFSFGYWSGDRCDPFFSRSCRYDPVIWSRGWHCDPWRWNRIDRCDWRPRYRHCYDPFFSFRIDWCDSWYEPACITPAPLIVTTPVVYLDPSPIVVQTFSNDISTTGLPAVSSGPFFMDAEASPSAPVAPSPVATVYRASGDLGEMPWSVVPSGIVDAVAGALPSQRAVAAARFLSRRPAGSWQVIYEDQTSTPDGVVVRTRALNASRLGAEPAVILVTPQLLSGVQPGAVLTVTGRLSELSIDDASYPGGVLTLTDARIGL